MFFGLIGLAIIAFIISICAGVPFLHGVIIVLMILSFLFPALIPLDVVLLIGTIIGDYF